MSSQAVSHQLIIGLPEAGKTTFLAALWHVVIAQEIDGAMRLKELHGDYTYLNDIRERWISREPIGRTQQTAEQLQLSMRLVDADNQMEAELVFPDLSGESFKALWEDRGWQDRYDQLARRANGAILFIHPDKVIEAMLISEISIPDGLGCDEDVPETVKQKRWHAGDASTQVKLVEFLQFFTHDPAVYPLSRVAVVISAWDVVREKITPIKWLEKRLPLLHQYLESNRQWLASRIYGLSAQAGDLKRDAVQLQGYLRHSERIQIIGEDCSEHDITAPIKWLTLT